MTDQDVCGTDLYPSSNHSNRLRHTQEPRASLTGAARATLNPCAASEVYLCQDANSQGEEHEKSVGSLRSHAHLSLVGPSPARGLPGGFRLRAEQMPAGRAAGQAWAIHPEGDRRLALWP